MCQKIWAGVCPSLPTPKLTQYKQFVKSGQKIWAGPSSPPPPNLDNLYHFFWTPMCQKVWAGVSPPPIPKLTQYIQFVKSGQKIWAGPSPPPHVDNTHPQKQLLFFGRPSLIPVAVLCCRSEKAPERACSTACWGHRVTCPSLVNCLGWIYIGSLMVVLLDL